MVAGSEDPAYARSRDLSALSVLCVDVSAQAPRSRWVSSGPSTLNGDQIAERGARMARRDDREYREYLREEQRRQPGCPAREVVLDQRGRATSRLPAASCADFRISRAAFWPDPPVNPVPGCVPEPHRNRFERGERYLAQPSVGRIVNS